MCFLHQDRYKFITIHVHFMSRLLTNERNKQFIICKQCHIDHLSQLISLFIQLICNIGGIEVLITVLGDAVYPLMYWLMKPYSDHGQLTGNSNILTIA